MVVRTFEAFETKVADLRRQVVDARELPPVMERFFDLSEGSDLMERSRPCAPGELEVIVKEIGRRLLGRAVEVEQALWLRLDEERFVHGAFLLGGVVTTAIWFDEPGVGLLAMAAFGPEGMHFVRFRPLLGSKAGLASRGPDAPARGSLAELGWMSEGRAAPPGQTAERN